VPKIWPITSSRSCNSAISCPSGGSGVLPIRICHLITGLDTGGAERSLVNLVTAMNRDEFENEVITLLKPGLMAQSLAQAGIPVTSMEIDRRRPNPTALLSLIRHLRAKKPTILQTWLYHADFFGTAAAVFARPDYLLWNLRSSEINGPGIPSSTRFLARLLAVLSRRPDAIVINSQDGQRYHDGIGYRPRRWINIPNGVDLARFRPHRSEQAMLRTRLGIPPDASVIGLVVRYHPMKDIETFLRAASRFQQDYEKVKFVLCGDGLGPDNSTLAKQVRALDLDRSIVLLGPRSDIELIYPALDVLTLCSIYGEGFPNVLCEAMACDVPCVATDVGDSAEIIGDCGLIVPKRDHEALAAGWQKLLKEESSVLNEGPRSRIAARYSLEKMCAHYESFYRSIAQKH
jgi:glycosyltransferase involved in cell wall biosynthesis